MFLDATSSSAAGVGSGSVLCHVGVHRGLGHLSRQATILRALRSSRNDLRITFHLASPDTHVLRPNEFPVRVGDPESEADLVRVVDEAEADVLIFDTFLPSTRPSADAFGAGEPPAVVLVLRKVFPDRIRAILSNPWMEWVQSIVVPHDRTEFVPRPADRYHAELVHAGPIVRDCGRRDGDQRLQDEDQRHRDVVLGRYGLARGEPFCLATTGGGGIPSYFEKFRNCVIRGVESARLTLGPPFAEMRWIFVAGPQNPLDGEIPARFDRVAFEPDLPVLISEARLVVSHTGYNTTQEILASGTPAVFLPMLTKYDDGLSRARSAVGLGVAEIVDDLEPRTMASTLEKLFGDPATLDAMRAASASISLGGGAERAAAAIGALVDRRRAQMRNVHAPSWTVSASREPGEPALHRCVRGVPVLVYRTVDDRPDAPGAVTREALRSQLDWLERNAKVVALEDVADRITAGDPVPAGAVVLTFDDAYLDTLAFVLPELARRKMPATFFLPTRWLGKWDEWNTRCHRVRQHFTWDDAKRLLAEGHGVGVQGRANHALVKFDRDELKKELQGAARDIEDALGVVPIAVAYPHGVIAPLVLKIAKKMARLGFVWEDGEDDWRTSPLAIRRIQVRPFWRLPEFAHALSEAAASAQPDASSSS
ncbi:MAG: polysaccharide deacetylase family protein [Candidatus Eisenbacteria bacterium]